MCAKRSRQLIVKHSIIGYRTKELHMIKSKIKKTVKKEIYDKAAAVIKAKEAFDKAKERLERVKGDLKDCVFSSIKEGKGEGVLVGGDFLIERKGRKGAISYKKIPELEGVDLEPYRSEKRVEWLEVKKVSK